MGKTRRDLPARPPQARAQLPRETPVEQRSRKPWLIAAALLLVYLGLGFASATSRSATFDEPLHLAAGYAALVAGDHRVDPSHPPLARIWAAVPLLLTPRQPLDTSAIDRAEPVQWLGDNVRAARRFLFSQPDPDASLAVARMAIVGLGALLGALLFSWTWEWLGAGPAVVALLCYVVSPNLIAHGSLVTTDLPVTCFLFASVYALWRVTSAATAARAAWLALAVALTITVKFSGVLILPVVVVGLATAAFGGALSWRRATAIAAATLAVGVIAIWAVYGFRYEPSSTPGWTFHLEHTDLVTDRAGWIGVITGAIDTWRLLPNAYTQGFLFSMASSRVQSMYLLGDVSLDGWWYYFPLAFLVKTPLVAVALAAIGACAWPADARPHIRGARVVFLAIPVLVVVLGGVASAVNIGVRHILPIYPFVVMACAAGAARLWTARARLARPASVAAVLMLVAEFASIFPHTLTYFNQLAGGPAQGIRILADSNIDWGQHLHLVKRWMTTNGVAHVNLAYFGTADPSHYGIDATLLPGTPIFDGMTIGKPRLPGYVAISANMLSGQYLRPEWRLYYREFRDMVPATTLGHTIRVYWVDRWPEPDPHRREADDIDTVRALADGLSALGSYNHAALHYRDVLALRPTDARARARLGRTLVQAGQIDAGLDALTTSADLAPGDPTIRYDHGLALLMTGRTEQAERYAESWLRLSPTDPAAWYLYGLVADARGRAQDANHALRQALAIDPTFTPAQEALADFGAAR